MEVARIDRDYIQEELTTPSRVGESWLAKDFGSPSIATDEPDQWDKYPKIRFRCKDDDGEIYYGGWLLNDPDGLVQFCVLEWTQRDAGCTTIEVKLDGKWVQEIG